MITVDTLLLWRYKRTRILTVRDTPHTAVRKVTPDFSPNVRLLKFGLKCPELHLIPPNTSQTLRSIGLDMARRCQQLRPSRLLNLGSVGHRHAGHLDPFNRPGRKRFCVIRDRIVLAKRPIHRTLPESQSHNHRTWPLTTKSID